MSTEITIAPDSQNLEEFISHLSLSERRALELLGSGAGPEQVASAVGVTTGFISQLLAQEDFAAAVADLRFQSLSSYNTRDSKIDSLEDQLLEKLENLLPMMFRPMEVVRAYATINAAKRRGAAAPTAVHATQNIVNITLPQIIVDRFTQSAVTTNINNQVIKAGTQDLITMQSGTLLATCKGDTDAALISRAARNREQTADVGDSSPTARASALLLRAKAQIAGGESQSRGQNTLPSFIPAGS